MLSANTSERLSSSPTSSTVSDVEKKTEKTFKPTSSPPCSPVPSSSSEVLTTPMDRLSATDRRFVDSDLEGDALTSSLIGTSSGNPPCEGCKNWEERFKALQKEHTSVSNRLSATVADLHTMKRVLEETQGRAKAEKNLFEEQTASYEERIENLGERIKVMLKDYQAYRRSTETELGRLEHERLTAQMEMSEIEEHYRTLLGKRRNAAAEMSAPIDLPSGREDLELYALQVREELLSTNVSCEHLRNRLDVEMAINKDKLNEEQNKRIQAEKLLRQRTIDANERITELTNLLEVAQASAASKQSLEKATERVAADLKRHQVELVEKEKALKRVREENAKLRVKVINLQHDLENTEKTSQDFVRLSQHLQIQLERHREQTHEVRWQEPDDITQCAGCSRPFDSGNSSKQNCRHCGAIFCPLCLTKAIPPSGNRSRPAPVCDMCHTLLIKDAAPYFSTGDFPKVDGNESNLQSNGAALTNPNR
nr:Rab GTPase binding effector protein 1 [Hymenolepis microstoma]